MDLAHTRAIINAIHDGSLRNQPTTRDEHFGFEVPTACRQVPSDVLIPRNTWADGAHYDRQARQLAELFARNFESYRDGVTEEMLHGGPVMDSVSAS